MIPIVPLYSQFLEYLTMTTRSEKTRWGLHRGRGRYHGFDAPQPSGGEQGSAADLLQAPRRVGRKSCAVPHWLVRNSSKPNG